MSRVAIGNRLVGEGQPVFVTLEAGATHDGPESAAALVRLAAAAGADAVKFQILDPDRLVADRKLLFAYEVLVDRDSGRTERVEEPLYDILARRALAESEWRALKRLADQLGLAFFATVGFPDEIDFVAALGCQSIKIASADVNHFPLLRRAARTGLALQMDTGSATLGEIEAAVDVVLSEGNDQLIIHQCPSGYPARLSSINLRVIETLRAMFPFPIAFSDHTPGRDMDIAAVAMGASLVEKTITLDRLTRSVEHVMSLEAHAAAAFVTAVRDLEQALGGPRRILADEERRRRINVRRSVHLVAAVSAGDALASAQVDFRRPGDGIAPDTYETLGAARFARDLPAGAKLSLADLEF